MNHCVLDVSLIHITEWVLLQEATWKSFSSNRWVKPIYIYWYDWYIWIVCSFIITILLFILTLFSLQLLLLLVFKAFFWYLGRFAFFCSNCYLHMLHVCLCVCILENLKSIFLFNLLPSGLLTLHGILEQPLNTYTIREWSYSLFPSSLPSFLVLFFLLYENI